MAPALDLDALIGVLSCPDCRAALAPAGRGVTCRGCGREYQYTANGILSLMPSQSKPLPSIYEDPDFKKYRELYEQDTAAVYYSDKNALFNWIHHSAHKRTHAFWEAARHNGWLADVGCGTGDHLAYFPDLRLVIGIDTSLGSLNVARQRYPDATLLHADINALPLASGSLGSVFSIYNLEHLFDLSDALSEIKRVLESRGRFFVGLPTEGGLAWGLGRRLSTDRIYSRKYGIDYRKVMRIEHCNSANQVMRECRRFFAQRRAVYFPALVPHVHPNLTISAEFQRA